jgi:hypothetical protein
MVMVRLDLRGVSYDAGLDNDSHLFNTNTCVTAPKCSTQSMNAEPTARLYSPS